MFKGLSKEFKQLMIDELRKRYDSINMKLQDDFVRIHYEQWQIQQMKEELKRIDEIINISVTVMSNPFILNDEEGNKDCSSPNKKTTI